jgi:hypothetical protein
MLSGIRLVAVRRLFTDTAAPIPDTISIPYAAAAAEDHDDADPATPIPSHTDTLDDRRRLNDLEDEVHRYRGLLDDVTGHMASQQAAHDNALASSQAQMNQLLAAFAATTAAAQSSQMLAVSSGPDYAAAAATNVLPYSQQGDCPSADADSTVRANTAAQNGNLSARMPAISSGQMSAVSSGPDYAAAAATNGLPYSQQGDCPSVDADSTVRKMENAAVSDAASGESGAANDPDDIQLGENLLSEQLRCSTLVARGCDSPADALMLLIKFRVHDAPLFCDKGRRWTTNCASLFAFIKAERPDLTAAFLQGISRPGHAARQAIQEFLAAVASWLDPELYTLTGLLLAGLTFDRGQPAAADANDMVRLAVRCYDTLGEKISTLERDGYFDRKWCCSGDISMLPGYTEFNPGNPLGAQRWYQLHRLLVIRFGQPACRLTELRFVKLIWLQHIQQIEEEINRFLSDDEVLYDAVVRAGGQYPDHLRIEVTKPRLTEVLRDAFDDFNAMGVCLGTYASEVEYEWDAFSAALIRVGASLLMAGSGSQRLDIPDDAQNPAAARQRVIQPMRHNAQDGCWRWSHVGECDFGDNCKFKHLGEAGALRHTVADADGNCLMLKRGTCTRRNCPFEHGEEGAAAKALLLNVGLLHRLLILMRSQRLCSQSYMIRKLPRLGRRCNCGEMCCCCHILPSSISCK